MVPEVPTPHQLQSGERAERSEVKVVSRQLKWSGHLADSFLDRVRSSYKLMLGTAGTKLGRTWKNINKRQASVHAALMAGNNNELRKIFADPISSDLFFGMDNLSLSILGRNFDEPRVVEAEIDGARRDLYRLARALRIDHALDSTSFDCEEVLRRIDRLLNQVVEFPNVFRGELGLPTTRGTASYRAIQAIYQAARLVSLLACSNEKSVVEIGPGMGRTAYYAYHAGLTDYTTIDLPMGTVAQACFLGATLGPEKIWMICDDGQLVTGRIKLLAAGQTPNRKFGIALNVDSMTEMPLSAALYYVDWIRRQSQLFLSVNHDRNEFTVKNIATVSLRTANRHPYPMRDGYWEEIFISRKSTRSIARRLRQQFSIMRHLAGFVLRRVPPFVLRRIRTAFTH